MRSTNSAGEHHIGIGSWLHAQGMCIRVSGAVLGTLRAESSVRMASIVMVGGFSGSASRVEVCQSVDAYFTYTMPLDLMLWYSSRILAWVIGVVLDVGSRT